MRAPVKGTVTPMGSMIPVEQARIASQRVQEAIGEKHKELDSLQHFIVENANLINLVQHLPDELHHQIMVPFGKAAFFPGRLVHTNEFMVLLGDGYYAEGTAKQTIEILKRRGKTLELQVDPLKAVIEDLKVEASFFDRTATEVVEGMVEIREEYPDDDSVQTVSKSDLQESCAPGVSEVDSGAREIGDKEYARMMSRMDELEREELEAEDMEDHEDDEQEETEDAEDQEDDEQDEDLANLDGKHSEGQCLVEEVSDISHHNDADKSTLPILSSRRGHRGHSPHGEGLMQTHKSKPPEKDYVHSILKPSAQPGHTLKSEVPVQMPEPEVVSRLSRPNTDSLKAFTGSIIERTDNLQLNPEKQSGGSQPSSSQPSKPVSRFKMQRR